MWDANARTTVIAELDGTVLDGGDGALPLTALVDEDRRALSSNMFVNGESIRYSEDKVELINADYSQMSCVEPLAYWY